MNWSIYSTRLSLIVLQFLFIGTNQLRGQDSDVRLLLGQIDGSGDSLVGRDASDATRRLDRLGCSLKLHPSGAAIEGEVSCSESRVMARMQYLRIAHILKENVPDEYYIIHPVTVTTQVSVLGAMLAVGLTFRAIQADEIKINGSVESIDSGFRATSNPAFKLSVTRAEWEKILNDNPSIGTMDLQSALKGLVYLDWYKKALAREELEPVAEVGK